MCECVMGAITEQGAASAGTCDSVCCDTPCPGAVPSLDACLEACENSSQCRFATYWNRSAPYCYLQRDCDVLYKHPDGEILQVHRKRKTLPQRRRFLAADADAGSGPGPGSSTLLQFPILQTVLRISAAATGKYI
eukprot:COSAG06_NODE_333_length_17341_cov_7.601032_10_plen_135_part_00